MSELSASHERLSVFSLPVFCGQFATHHFDPVDGYISPIQAADIQHWESEVGTPTGYMMEFGRETKKRPG